MARELALVAPTVRVVVALGGYAWQAMWPALKDAGYELPRSRPPFRHGVEVEIRYAGAPVTLIGCYHPSQQNTFTGRVTAQMLDDVFTRARSLAV
jgi:uracil-DNA glycosylase